MFALRCEVIEVRGQKVIVREMTAEARMLFAEEYASGSKAKAPMLLVQHCMMDADGKALRYGAADFDQVKVLPPDVIDAVSKKVLEMAGPQGGAEESPKG